MLPLSLSTQTPNRGDVGDKPPNYEMLPGHLGKPRAAMSDRALMVRSHVSDQAWTLRPAIDDQPSTSKRRWPVVVSSERMVDLGRASPLALSCRDVDGVK